MATSIDAAPRRPGVTTRPLSSQAIRGDIQGLRTIAVMSVLLYHLWPTRLAGGFVGVDVFFVISGFLITSHLLREVTATGGLRLGKFWAARVRRLLPAALLVSLVTGIATLVWVPRRLWEQFLGELIASTLYFQNWLLAGDSVDYLAAGNLASPAQHFWSLSVEEQFYVMLPILLIGCIGLARLVKRDTSTVVLVALSTVTVGSLAYSVYLTGTNAGVAYFSTFTRMWEFGLGCLTAYLLTFRPQAAAIRRPVREVISWVGLAGIAAAVVMINNTTPFPSYTALLPVLGTVAVLGWGSFTSVDRIGSWLPISEIGRISYALYLWHWPLIVIVPYITERDLTTVDKLLIGAGSIALAWFSTTYYEEPLRFSVASRVGTRRVLAGIALAMVPVVGLCALGIATVARERDAAAAEVASILDGTTECLGAQAMAPGADCSGVSHTTVIPELAQVLKDDSNRSECWSNPSSPAFKTCTVGPTQNPAKHLLAIGDSHSNTLIAAYERIAEQRNWRIDIAGRAACYWTDAIQPQKNAKDDADCKSWQAAARAYVSSAVGLDAVITTHSAGGNSASPTRGSISRAETVAGLTKAWASAVDAGVPVIAIRDNPMATKGTIQCIEQSKTVDAPECALDRSDALSTYDGQREAVAATKRARLIDLTDFYCGERTCPVVIGGVIVYRDGHHVTATYVATLAPYLGDEIDKALRDLA